jgi:hypothetical protein
VHTDSKSAESEVIGAENQDKTRARPTLTLFVDLFKLQPVPQQMRLLELEHHVTIRPKAAYVPWRGVHL